MRGPQPGDLPGIADLLAGAGHEGPAAVLAARLDRLRQDPGIVLIAVEWGPPGGIVVAHWRQTLLVDRPVAFISLLHVAPDDRRRGLGRTLLKAVAQAARQAGCGSLHLAVSPGDDSLPGFCQATGFAPVGTEFVRPLRKGG